MEELHETSNASCVKINNRGAGNPACVERNNRLREMKY